jgi:hypothetical protein
MEKSAVWTSREAAISLCRRRRLMRRAEDGRGSRSWTSPRPIRCRADEPMAVAREIWHRGGRGDRIIVILGLLQFVQPRLHGFALRTGGNRGPISSDFFLFMLLRGSIFFFRKVYKIFLR